MKKFLTIQELQFLDLVLKFLSRHAGKTCKILFRANDLIMSGDFFAYDKNLEYTNIPKFLNKPKGNSIDIENFHYILRFLALENEFGQRFPERPSFLLKFPHVLTSIVLSDNFFKLKQEFPSELLPCVYSPTIYNHQMPALSFYLLDENKKYEVISLVVTE